MKLPKIPFASLLIPVLTLIILITTPVSAGKDDNTLFTDAVTYCAEAKAVIVDEFDVTYHRSNNSVTFVFSLASVESNLNVSANLYINAFGIQVLNQTLQLCELLEGVICPLPQVNFTGRGTYPIPSQFASKIPSIGFTVPNLEAYARIELIRTENNAVAACLQATLSNGKSTYQPAVVWVTAMFTLIAFLVALWHTGSTTSPSPIQYRWFDILFVFQAAAATGLLHLNYPLIYSNFVQNFHWALGLFYSSNMQSSINRMRAKTGGTMDSNAYSEVQYINRKLSPYNVYTSINDIASSSDSLKTFFKEHALSESSLAHVHKRAVLSSALPQNATTDLNTGLPVYTNTLNIPEANAYDTIWFIFLALIAIFIAFHAILYAMITMLEKLDRDGPRLYWAKRLRGIWWPFCIGNGLRLCLIGFFPIFIFGFWQFHIRDSGLSVFFAVVGILLCLVPLAIAFVLSILRSRRISSTMTDVNSLYISSRYFHSIGVHYRQYRQKYHWFWFAPYILAMFMRAGFIAFGPANAWAQVIGNIVVEFLLLCSLLVCRPHKDKKGDWLGAFLTLFRMIAFGLLIAFIPSVGVKPIPRAVIAFVIIVAFGIPVIVLFIGFIWNIGYGYLWRKQTTRVEDGLYIKQRFSPTASDSSDPQPIMQHIDATQFVSSRAAVASRRSLDRRASLIEPVGDDSCGGRTLSTSSGSGDETLSTLTNAYTYGKEEQGHPVSGMEVGKKMERG
ncbi:hypothetical protein L204_101880 [Cryptococcus depauperatus]|nr:integral membrane protein [Cryptococcus depauperatus CBS 7855]